MVNNWPKMRCIASVGTMTLPGMIFSTGLVVGLVAGAVSAAGSRLAISTIGIISARDLIVMGASLVEVRHREVARSVRQTTIATLNAPASLNAPPAHHERVRVKTAYAFMSSTTRKRALPLIMRSYPSAAFASGYTSFIDRTPVCTLKPSVSWESMDVPEDQPSIARRPATSTSGDGGG